MSAEMNNNSAPPDSGDNTKPKAFKRRGPGRRMGMNKNTPGNTGAKKQKAALEMPKVIPPAGDIPSETGQGEERLHKVLANVGLGSRRDMELLIADGKVEINGVKAVVGQKVKSTDRVHVKRRPVNVRIGDNKPQVLIYHKPPGEIVTRDDPEDRETVFEGLPRPSHGKWIAVGRLDYNSEGLLIFTTYGELANRLMHPRYEVKREYAVRIMGELNSEQEDQLIDGVMLDDGLARALSLERHDIETEGANHWYRIVMQEGRNREVRRMFEAVGLMVSRLIRTQYGEISMPSWLKRGQHKLLDDLEIASLLTSVGLRTPEEKAAKLARYSTNPKHLQKQMDAMPGVIAGIEQDGKVKPLTKKARGELIAMGRNIDRELAKEFAREDAAIAHQKAEATPTTPLIKPRRVLAGKKVATYQVVNGRAAPAGTPIAAALLEADRDDVPRGRGFAKRGKTFAAKTPKRAGKPASFGVYDPFNSNAQVGSGRSSFGEINDDNRGNLIETPKHNKTSKFARPVAKKGPPKKKQHIKIKVDKTARPPRPIFHAPEGATLPDGSVVQAEQPKNTTSKPKRQQRRGMRKIAPREPNATPALATVGE
jgi:23S rRNA pseudouridine2605 synthase